jgi:hypothetical protein
LCFCIQHNNSENGYRQAMMPYAMPIYILFV